jgi:hypothetical protein
MMSGRSVEGRNKYADGRVRKGGLERNGNWDYPLAVLIAAAAGMIIHGPLNAFDFIKSFAGFFRKLEGYGAN